MSTVDDDELPPTPIPPTCEIRMIDNEQLEPSPDEEKGDFSESDDNERSAFEEEVYCENDCDYDGDASEMYSSRLAELEEEQEQLNSSLIALTSHFAQVQLRLKQIVDAEPDEKERLLKDLEEFAFRGIPDLREPDIEFDRNLVDLETADETKPDNVNQNSSPRKTRSGSDVSKLELQRIKQKELIVKLKEQLEDLEKYAYETGNTSALPSSVILERQSVIIEQLKGKLPLNLDEMDKLSPEDLRRQVDLAIRDVS